MIIRSRASAASTARAAHDSLGGTEKLEDAGNAGLSALVPQGPHPGRILTLTLAFVLWVSQS